MQKKVDASLTSRNNTAFPSPLEREVNSPHPKLCGRELYPAMSAIPETTWIESQSYATSTGHFWADNSPWEAYTCSVHGKDKQQHILRAWTGSETEPNKKVPSPVLTIRLRGWAINL